MIAEIRDTVDMKKIMTVVVEVVTSMTAEEAIEAEGAIEVAVAAMLEKVGIMIDIEIGIGKVDTVTTGNDNLSVDVVDPEVHREDTQVAREET